MVSNFRKLLLIIFISGFLALYAACSFNYSEAMLEEEIAEDIPNAVITNIHQISVRKGEVSFILESSSAEMYDQKNLTAFTNLSFVEYRKNAEIATEGEAAYARYYSNNDNVEFEKSFDVVSKQNKYSMEGESISWDGQQRILSSQDDKEVTLKKEDGTFVTGKGFKASAGNKSFSYSSGAEGVYVSED